MRSLTMFRHAKTEHDSPSGRDFDRVLAERGRRDATRMGDEFRALGLSWDLVLSSPARRAAQTANLAGLDPVYDERIYDASTGYLLAIVQETPSSVRRLMLVGHNPGFEQLAAMLAGLPLDMATGTAVELVLPVDDWAAVGKERGTLARMLRPKELG
ncbi:SixA phosphatase family protein [Sphingomonas xanthus]|uniref:SixA phosphatase family protein n=1 Tax=Sphingomonas xanthus TaxID=2594473 RepID=UPI001FE41157|nr:histidine phosphatase family protein [Sphingomonas xanthus]